MKRFLKPTGRLLTTAVFTSTALEPFMAATAASPPLADDPPSDTNHQVLPDDAPLPKATTVLPPEALINQEFAQQHPPLTPFHVSVDSPEPSLLPLGLDPTGELAETSPSVPPIDFAFQTLPDLAPSTELDADDNVSDPHASGPPSSTQEQPNLRSSHGDSSKFSSVDSPPSSSPLQASSEAAPRPPEESGTPNHPAIAPPQGNSPTPTALSDAAFQASAVEEVEEHQGTDGTSPAVHNTVDNDDVISATREWLDEALARIVNRDRLSREQQFRANLMQSARDSLAQGDLEQAKRIAENPALTEEERDDLWGAIAEVESNATYPFVSADHAFALNARAIHDQSRPSREWLLAQMDAAVEQLDPTCYDTDRSTFSASIPANTSIPEVFNGFPSTDGRNMSHGGGSGGTGQDVFLSGGEFLSGVGHQPPSMTARRSMPPRTRRPVQHSPVARQENCTPTFGQNIGGLTFATLSGYQWVTRFARPGNVLRMVFPLAIPAVITSHFGWRVHPIYGNRRFHFGIDFGAPSGTPVVAALPGRVETSHYLDGYGLTVILENQDLEQRTLYAHMSGIAVRPGTWIEQGDIIGWVGSTGNSTGPHLHFEVHHRQNAEWVAVDPLQAAAQLFANRPGVPVP